MGVFDEKAKTKPVATIGPHQEDLLRDFVIPEVESFLGSTSTGIDLDALLGKTGLTSTSILSLAGLENIAAGGGESAEVGGASRDALTQILQGGPEDVEEFVQKSVFEPSLAEAQRLIPLLQREGSARGDRFGTPTNRAIGELLADVNRTSTAARAAASLQARQQDQRAKIASAQLGILAESAEIQNLVALANAGNLEANLELQNIASVLGIPARIIALAAGVATAPTRVGGAQGPNIFAQELAGVLGSQGNTFGNVQQGAQLTGTGEGGGILSGAGGGIAGALI